MATNKLAIRRDTAANWTSANPTLVAGEFALETDSHKLKNGDGATAYTSLGYLRPINAVTVTGNHTVASNEDVINVNAASATITLPAADVIGRRVTVRKVSASAGTVTVSRASTDTITRATLTSVTLTSNGDFWTLEVVASGRWDLVDGFETIGGTNDGIKRHDGTMEQWDTETLSAGGSISFAVSFTATPAIVGTVSASGVGVEAPVIAFVTVSASGVASLNLRDTAGIQVTTRETYWRAIGRWYA